MKILITGSAGFIGSALSLRLLGRGDEILGIDNHNDYYDPALKVARLERHKNYANYKHIRMDIKDRENISKLFKTQQFECVINLAAAVGVRYSLKNPTAYIDSNLVGFGNILEGCRQTKVAHLIYASSSSIYGANTHMPFSENDGVNHPVSLYGATKKANELMAHSYAHLYNFAITGLRFFTVYGPWDRPDMALQSFTRAMLKGEPSTVLVSNEETKNIVNKFYKVDKNKIKIIPNGVNISKFKHIQTNSKKIIFSGVMYHHRGLDVLIDAAPLVIKEIPDVEIELYGEGPELAKLKALVKEKKLESNVKFMGWISNDKIPDVLSKASIGLGPLRKTEVTSNALPIKVLEYMASSLPIIAISGTLPKDVLIDGENGYFVKNHTELALKIIEILSNEDKQYVMGKKSSEIVENFDWKTIIEKIIKLA